MGREEAATSWNRKDTGDPTRQPPVEYKLDPKLLLGRKYKLPEHGIQANVGM